MIDRAPLGLLYVNVLIIATCGLVYELVAGTLASYLLGDSVTQFSLIIGVYLSALGVGAWLSQYLEQRLARTFIEIELALALIGGFSTPLLFLAFPLVDWFQTLLYSSVLLIGILVGLELPLLMRILKEHLDFSELVSRVLAFDYLGALFASVLFPIFLVPRLGLTRTAILFGLLNAAVGLWGTYLLRPLLPARGLEGLRGRAVLVIGLLIVGFIKADSLTTLAEENTLGGQIIYADTSPYQRIAVTQDGRGFQLYLNGHLQFNSVDEYRYHEALVHPLMGVCPDAKRILVLGGGDGLAVRELLRYPNIESITLVDLDPAMTRLATQFEPLAMLNERSLSDPKVAVINQDAFVWAKDRLEPLAADTSDSPDAKFDAVVIDFPDPSSYSVGKLYTTYFYRALKRHLAPDAGVAIQCTSPLVAPKSYWCILQTLRQSGFDVSPYHASVPTFGVWGFALARPLPTDSRGTERVSSGGDWQLPPRLNPRLSGLKFLNDAAMRGLFDLPADQQTREVSTNRLNDQILVRLYDEEWGGRN
ncbi:polyamine aminopropyltransferase [Allorhodopirellula heiligendammensis]|uniref:Polyamine aminopropyltransferase n=1 Tax=Allorhodopirellula heiligendammensis TaxID=2714739 RepID=A0A5C6BX31_9BACT|nr:polyamine aminopropyltransferase [Allorhodopirellula heiligendammensis]TWU15836.1 Spermidine synthase [Allorhodopirellula heiligendammensis]